MNKIQYRIFSLVFLIILLTHSRFLFAQTNTSSVEAISQAGQSIDDAYKAIAKAEEAGADIGVFIALLNDAMGLHDLAGLLHAEEEFEEAIQLANQAIDICNHIISETEKARNQILISSFTQYVIQIILILFIIFYVYKVVKRNDKSQNNKKLDLSLMQIQKLKLPLIIFLY